MKILKHGDLKPRKFECASCGCEFVANIGEYEESYCGIERYFCVECPDCGYYVSAHALTAELYYMDLED